MSKCYFNWKYKCCDLNATNSVSNARIQTIIKSSDDYGDGIGSKLKQELTVNSSFTIQCHRSCVSSYTSLQKRNRHLKRKQFICVDSPSPKKLRHSHSHERCFSFRKHCIFCAEACPVDKTKKNPSRWRPMSICRTADSSDGTKSFKETLLETCSTRNDNWSKEVKLRVDGALSDLHAADARYHIDCKNRFLAKRSVLTARRTSTSGVNRDDDSDPILSKVIGILRQDTTKVWSSIDIEKLYVDNGGSIAASRKTIVSSLIERFGGEILVLSSNGIANIVVFRSNAANILRVLPNDDDNLDIALRSVSKKIIQESRNVETNKQQYSIRIDKEKALLNVSTTIMDLLTQLSPKLDRTPPALLIGNIITNVLTNHVTNLQIALGVILKESKALVNYMHDFRVTCSYDELLRFKKSAAVAAVTSTDLAGLSSRNHGLIQAVADNFDADISSQNGKASTHSLALLMTQPQATVEATIVGDIDEHIPRIRKTDMSKPLDYGIDICHYQGPKKPRMPNTQEKKTIPSLAFLCRQTIAVEESNIHDFQFLNSILTNDDCPEFNGFNTKLNREKGLNVEWKTKAQYLPLIDMTPSDPDTIMTALKESQRLTIQCGQDITVLTCDQQLYRVAMDVIWSHPEQFSNVVLRLGGMHLLMSFLGCIGTLMDDSGLSDILESTFGGVSKMLSGKKFPQNIRALRLVTEEVLRPVLQQLEYPATMDGLLSRLEMLSEQSRTTKLWVECLIKPVLITMMYIRAEREGEWTLHMHAVRKMLPYFFAAGHVNYARYGLLYLRQMEDLPPKVLSHFLKGEHVMHHLPGYWNGIWSDMFIETTFMRYGHGHSGIIGITLKEETLKTWAMSRHICSQLESDMKTLTESENLPNKQFHKEEMKARIESDRLDRESIRDKLDLCMDPLNPNEHSSEIVNIVNGRKAPEVVNVDKAYSIGCRQMKEYEEGWPDSFHQRISKQVVTQAVGKKYVKIGEMKVFDTNLIYSRVIGLLASSRDLDVKDVFRHELSPVPTSMFTDTGDMRTAKAKSQLKKLLQKESSKRRSAHNIKCVVIDGSAVLWVVHWPSKGTVNDYVNSFKKYIANKLSEGDVYLVFDRYYDCSTKSVTRSGRSTEASKVHQLGETMALPSQKVVLTVTENKKQLIKLICNSIMHDFQFSETHTQQHKLVVTGEDETPFQIYKGHLTKRHDMRTSHEEADTILVRQMVMAAQETQDGVSVISDDTDVFILLLNHYLGRGLSSPVLMESPIQQRVVIDIHATVEAQSAVVPELIGLHALTGCDTVATCMGIGKGTALKVLRGGNSLSLLGDESVPLEEVITQATSFMTTCYGQSKSRDMSEARWKLWTVKSGKGVSNMKLCSLPPTSEAFTENVKRAHFQACIWKHALDPDIPALDVTEYGWQKDGTKTIKPVTVPNGIALAPKNIMKLIKCNCGSNTPCRSQRCTCNHARLPCTIFCSCSADIVCGNELTKSADEDCNT